MVDRMQASQRMQWAAMVAGWQVRGTHHRQGRSQQHVFNGGTSLQLGVGFSNDMLRRRFFNELH